MNTQLIVIIIYIYIYIYHTYGVLENSFILLYMNYL